MTSASVELQGQQMSSSTPLWLKKRDFSSEKGLTIPVEIVKLIADHIDPSPVVYSRLAAVSRTFYFVFTSDNCWEFLDPFDWKKNIFRKFRELSANRRCKLADFWSERFMEREFWFLKANDPMEKLPPPSDRYKILGMMVRSAEAYARRRDVRAPLLSLDRSLLMCAININPYAIYYSMLSVRGNMDVYEAAIDNFIRREKLPYLTTEMYNNIELVKRAVAYDERVLEELPSKNLFRDRNYMLQMVNANPLCLRYDVADLRQDQGLMVQLVEKSGMALRYLPDDFCKDGEMVSLAVAQNPRAIQYSQLPNDRDLVLDAVSRWGSGLQFTRKFANDFEVVLAAVKNDAKALQFASARLQNDVEIVQAAVAVNPQAVRFASSELRNDPDFMTSVIKSNPMLLRWAGPKTRNNRLAVLIAIKGEAMAFQYASDELKGDFELAYIAMLKNPLTFHYASPALRANEKLGSHALRHSVLLLPLVKGALQEKREIFWDLVTQHPAMLEYASESLRDDMKLVLRAVSCDGMVLRFVSPRLQNYKNVVRTAVNQNPSAFVYASEKQRGDPAIALTAVRDGEMLEYVSHECKLKRDIVSRAFEAPSTSEILVHCLPKFKKDPQLVLQAVKSQARNILHASSSLTRSREFIEKAMRANGLIYTYLPEELKDDSKLATLAVMASGKQYVYLPHSLQQDKSIALEAFKTYADVVQKLNPSLLWDTGFMEQLVALHNAENKHSGCTLSYKSDTFLRQFGLKVVLVNHRIVLRHARKPYRDFYA